MTQQPRSVLVLQHAAAEGLGRLADLLTERGIAAEVVGPDEALPGGGLARTSGLIVLGGPMGVYEGERYPRLADELALLRSALAAGTPILGICLGSQLLAAALGARVAPGPKKELGWYDVTLAPGAARDRLFGGAPPRFSALHWHGDVFELPAGAASLARSELTEHQAFTHGNAWGVLFHLEARVVDVQAMVRAFPDEVAAAGQHPAQLLADTDAYAARSDELARRVFSPWIDLLLGG